MQLQENFRTECSICLNSHIITRSSTCSLKSKSFYLWSCTHYSFFLFFFIFFLFYLFYQCIIYTIRIVTCNVNISQQTTLITIQMLHGTVNLVPAGLRQFRVLDVPGNTDRTGTKRIGWDAKIQMTERTCITLVLVPQSEEGVQRLDMLLFTGQIIYDGTFRAHRRGRKKGIDPYSFNGMRQGKVCYDKEATILCK